ncbi:beta strand repeat-containing protein, partial [Robiginitalea sp.]|uniref:beta strand repeat-containing protein n=1 Tax=Robiginitalea sp. TaxID=1902411 RepID=UPI003C7890EF
QQITDFSLSGNIVTLTLEDGGTQTVDLSGYVSTDDQALSLSGNTLTLEDGGNVNLAPYLDNTDEQDLTGATLTGTDLQIDIENGSSASVDLSSLVGTDNQALSLSGNTLTLEDGGNVDLSGFVSTDDQNIAGSVLSGTNLTIGIENGTNQTIDLSSLVDDADADPSNEIQDLSLSGNTLNLSGDASPVDLTAYLDNTDAQTLSITGDQLSIANGNTVTVPTADGSETEVNGGGINVVSGSGTSGDPYVVTGTEVDGSVTNEVNTAFGVNGGNLEITDSNSTLSVALSSLGSDDQILSTSGAAGNIQIENGNTLNLNVNDADADPANELQTLSQSGTDVTLSDGGGTISVADNDNDSANEIQDLDLTGNTLTITDNGSATPIDLSTYLDNTDDQEGTEVNLTVALDSDGDGVNETTVEESLSAIAPITSGAARVFYPPSIAIDASTNGTGFTVDLYAQYIAQFENVPVRSPGAPLDIPTYAATDLYYYVTLADPAVFSNMSIDANGVLTYNIIGQPSDYNSLINVVFVVR